MCGKMVDEIAIKLKLPAELVKKEEMSQVPKEEVYGTDREEGVQVKRVTPGKVGIKHY